MAQDPLVDREELTATLFAIADINQNVREILTILQEDADGEEAEDNG